MSSHPIEIPIFSPGQLLSAYRRIRAMTQEQLAELVDVSAASVHNYENSKQEPSAAIWARLVQALDIPESKALEIWR